MGEIKDKDHLSPAEAEVGAELGNIIFVYPKHLWKLVLKKESYSSRRQFGEF